MRPLPDPTLVRELAEMELLDDVPAETLHEVAAAGHPRALAPGEVLLSPEHENEHVYLLLDGALTVHFGVVDSPPIRELARGANVGELSVIDGIHPSAYVVAQGPARVFAVHRDLIRRLVGHDRPIGRNLLNVLIQWMRANTRRMVADQQQIWELTDHANIDPLTGLYNRRWLDGVLGRLLAQAASGFRPLCVLLLDVDHFKAFNDRHGHPGGDQALATLGRTLKATLRANDFAVRYGGEEFLVLLTDTPRKEGLAVAERVRRAAEEARFSAPTGEALPGITVSIGLCTNEGHATADALVAAADARLYEAKQLGRNRVCG